MPSSELNIWQRLWIYQKERFPIFAHGILIAIFVITSLSVSRLLTHDYRFPSYGNMLAAFLSTFLIFFQLRVADEFKDYDHDKKFRPYRAVPRGLVTLRTLLVLALLGAAIQLYTTYTLKAELLIYLGMVWTYMALMSVEFFAKPWLEQRHFIYMWSHMIIMVVINLYISAFDWLVNGKAYPIEFSYFLAMSFFGGVAVEFGRKIRSPEAEEKGVATYSYLWGTRNATYYWLASLGIMHAMGIAIGLITFYPALPAVSAFAMLATSLLVGLRFVNNSTTKNAKVIEPITGLNLVISYLAVGVAPLVIEILRG